jgi:hypothetical protein
MARDTVNLTAPVQDIARAYTIAADRNISLSELTIEAWKVLAEMSDSSSVNSVSSQKLSRRTSSASFDGIRLTDINLSDYQVGHPEHTAEKILWGQFSRFLPIKYTLRLLASIEDHPVPLVKWQDVVRDHSFLMREHLRDKDLRHRIPRGSQLSAGFPRGKTRKKDKSMERFLSHYTAMIQGGGNGPAVGMCAELGFIRIELPSKLVEFTEAGRQYVSLENPQLDGPDESIEPTSRTEREFLLNHLKLNLIQDWGFCADVMKSISDGWDSSKTLSAVMIDKYPNLVENTLRTNVGGALGRLSDLNLIDRSWIGRNVTYNITDSGLNEAN